jgi:hypothetical protein
LNYQDFVISKTKVIPNLSEHKINVLHMTLGLLGEQNKLRGAPDDILVLGDVLFYLYGLYGELGFEPEPYPHGYTYDIAELVKKYVFLDRPVRDSIVDCLDHLYAMLLDEYSLDWIEEAKKRNIIKLNKRYPDGCK